MERIIVVRTSAIGESRLDISIRNEQKKGQIKRHTAMIYVYCARLNSGGRERL